MPISREDIDKLAKASAKEIVRRLEPSAEPAPRGIDISKLPDFVYFWGSDRLFTIAWERHEDGTFSFTSQRLTGDELAEFIKD